MTRILIAALFCVYTAASFAQELNCVVEIEYSKTQATDPKVFETLRTTVAEFMNNRKWTNDVFEDYEKIDCTLFINIDEESGGNQFGGQLIIQAERPVYNSMYKTVVFSYKDDNFRFEYNEFDNLEFSDQTYFSNISSILGFYAYMLIGYDYESFAPEGGTQFFLKAQDVVNSIPGNIRATYPGWSTFDGSRNRAVLVNDLLNPRYQAYRDAIFDFHFNGLDTMYDDADKGREKITGSLRELKKVYDDNPTSMLIKIFFLAKGDELISLYGNAPSSVKDEVIELIATMDPVNTSKYREIR